MKDTRLTWLIAKRKAAGYDSARSFAKRVNISTSYYDRIEKGEQQAGGKTAHKIAQALEFDMALFFTRNVPSKGIKKAK